MFTIMIRSPKTNPIKGLMRIINNKYIFSDTALLSILLILASFLRLSHIDGGSMWFDEWDVLYVAFQSTASAIIAGVKTHIMAFPADYFVISILSHIPYSGDYIYRIPAFLFGLASIITAFKLGSRLYGRLFGLVLCLTIVMVPIHIRYSQELRFYSVLFFFSIFILLWAIHFSKKPSRRNYFIGCAMSVVGFHFHIMVAFSAIYFFATALVLALKQKRKSELKIKTFLLGASVSIILCLPVFIAFALPRLISGYSLHKQVYSLENITTLANDFVSEYFLISVKSLLPVTKASLLSLLQLIVVVIILFFSAKKSKRIGILLLYTTVIFLGYFYYIIHSGYYSHIRLFIFVYPSFAIAQSYGVVEILRLLRNRHHEGGNTPAIYSRKHSLIVIPVVIFYFFNLAIHGISEARNGFNYIVSFPKSDRYYYENVRAAIKFAMYNSTNEPIVFLSDNEFVRRSVRKYFELVGVPPSRIVVTQLKNFDYSSLPDRYWYLTIKEQLNKKDKFYGKIATRFMHGLRDSSIYLVTNTPPDIKNMNWHVDDARIPFSYMQNLWWKDRDIDSIVYQSKDLLSFIEKISYSEQRYVLAEWMYQFLLKIYKKTNDPRILGITNKFVEITRNERPFH